MLDFAYTLCMTTAYKSQSVLRQFLLHHCQRNETWQIGLTGLFFSHDLRWYKFQDISTLEQTVKKQITVARGTIYYYRNNYLSPSLSLNHRTTIFKNAANTKFKTYQNLVCLCALIQLSRQKLHHMESGRVYTTPKPTLKTLTQDWVIINQIRALSLSLLQQSKTTCSIICNNKEKYESLREFPNNSNYFEHYNFDSDYYYYY